MPEILVAENFIEANIGEKTTVAQDALPTQPYLYVENNEGYNEDLFLFIGEFGSDVAQIRQIDSIDGNKIKFTHNLERKVIRGDKVSVLRSDQVRFYYAPASGNTVPADGDFILSGSKDIQAGSLVTEFTEAHGGTGYWHKFTYYNSANDSESDLSDAIASRGGGVSYYSSVEAVRRVAGLQNNQWISDQYILTKLRKAQSEVNVSLLSGGYTLPLVEDYDEMVVNATELLAAGYLLTDDYGPEHTGTNKDGMMKLKMARDLLMKIETGTAQIIDGGTSLPVSKSAKVRGYPDNTTAGNYPDNQPVFSMNDKF